ncbi:AraC family transcriptional regulator [bacteria symbiont BFo1 of Frankliniella occidentalis]|jgi:transcriptional regulator GlxA family with amidase domain|uniref:GlxA family transcriptional regulator n=1 Tax=Erwinia aphidicola TaxID=68334 RepID=UPI00066473B9|nr:helix-turn-helix domain-containing protein [Erwinia aphidicola]KMV68187.1 AraC family transcriptional regulator [bacteria symbiont BFo1 of Frankliniella occidentalis]PIJ55961.1 AraC family transcriptional regulator [Erwinia sp. OLMDLW33]KYP83032.1 AraC family transcriptional regulator [bacteria symbiont BFo1 of Frankliniella occidentalis]KYP87718.1 AraC family transcriptional regulator [bacteria symbiont BFo1 of Frankliniella occidentalis]MBD1377904.1 helix-turn-helix domain-containing prot
MTIPVWFITLPGVMALDLTGPAETLKLARDAFSLRYIGPDESVLMSTDMLVSRIEPLPASLPDGSLLVLPGVSDSKVWFDTPQAMAVRNWLMRMQPAIHARKITLVCVCSGALLAAKAGLMKGVSCTTHHEVIERLKAAEPAALVKENRIFVEDRGIWTSAGITAGIDLCLHLIGHLCGSQVALDVAREMVVYFRRSGEDPQLSPWLRHRNHIHPAIHRVQDLLTLQPEQEWPLEEIAARVHVSSRHLTRLFRQHLGISVRDYHEQLRLTIARQRLHSGENSERAALSAGFSSSRQLRRALQRWQE